MTPEEIAAARGVKAEPEGRTPVGDLLTVAKVEAAQVESGIATQPYSLIDKLRRYGDKGLDLFRVSSDMPFVGVVPNIKARKDPNTLERQEPSQIIEKGVNKFLDNHPYVKTLVEQKSSGLGGPDLEALKPQWSRNITEEEYAIANEWAQEDPFVANGTGEVMADVFKLVVSQADILTKLGSFQYQSIFDMQFEENMQSAKAEFAKRNWEFDPETYKGIADTSALIQSGLEALSGGVSLKSLAGKNSLKHLLGKTAGSKGIALLKTAGGGVFAAGLEGATEGSQSFATATAVNVMLNQYAEANKLKKNPLSKEEIIDQTIQGAKLGIATGGGIQVASAPMQIRNALKKASAEKFLSTAIKEMHDEELEAVVSNFKDTARVYGEAALEKTDVELRHMLMEEEIKDLYNMAKALDMTVKMGTREELIEGIIENKLGLPEYETRAMENVMEQIEKSEKSSLQKHFYKWMAQGDINPEDIIPIRSVLDAMHEGSTHEGTLNEFFEEMVATSGKDGYINLNQIHGWHGGRSDSEGGPIANFDLSFAGTGEGVAAFGHGVYVTEKFGIGKSYAEKVQGSALFDFISGLPMERRQNDQLSLYVADAREEGKTGEDVLHTVEDDLRANIQEIEAEIAADSHQKGDRIALYEAKHTLQVLESNWDELSKLINSADSYLYKLSLFEGMEPQEYNLLSWYDILPGEEVVRIDRQLREQGIEINNVLNMTGFDVYHQLTGIVGSQEEASKTLQGIGIDGIVFPSQTIGGGSRELQEGSRNFVIFDEKNVKIQRAEAYSPELKLFQKGRTLQTGSEVIRGQIQTLQEGKFVLDLFKTGDVLTLAHEFSHLFSAWNTEDVNLSHIGSMLEDNHANLKGAALSAKKGRLTRIWSGFQADPFIYPSTLNEADTALFVEMQEYLAQSFERYISGEAGAPNHKVAPAFNAIRKRMLEYYKKHRMLPLQYQDVNINLAEAFDRMLSTDVILPENRTFEVTLTDSQGVTKKLFVNKSKPQEKEHRVLLWAMERATAEITGLHDAILDYAKMMLGSVPTGLRAKIGDSKVRADGYKLLNKIDGLAAKKQAAENKIEYDKVMAKIRELKAAKMPDEIKGMLDDVLNYLDPKKRKYERVKRGVSLAKQIRGIQSGILNAMPDQIRDMTKAQLDDIFLLNKVPIENLSKESLLLLYDQLANIGDYNSWQMRQAVEERDSKRAAFTKKGNIENNNNWRFQKNKNKNMSVKAMRISKKLSQAYLSDKVSQLDVMRILGEGNADSYWNNLADMLERGGHNMRVQRDKYKQFTRQLRKGVADHGVSTTLGHIKPSERKIIQMRRVDKDEVITHPDGRVEYKHFDDVPVTLGQLMMWYGWSQNKKAKRHLLEGGLRFEELGVDELYKFNNEAELYTALSQLPQEYRDIVDKTIDYYENVVYPELNEVYKKMNLGLSLPKEERYLPVAVEWANKGAPEFLCVDNIGEKNQDWYRKHIQSMEFLQTRTGGDLPLHAKDFFAAVAGNLDNVAFYMGMGEPLTEIRFQLFGAKNTGIHAQMSKMLGESGVKEMETFLDNLESGGYDKMDAFTKAFMKINSTARKGILNMSLGISALQPLSAILATEYDLNILDIMGAMGKEGTIVGAKSIKFFMELDPLLRERYERIPMVAMGAEDIDHRARRFWVEPTSVWNKLATSATPREFFDAVRNAEDSTMLMLMFMDSRALSVIYNATEKKGLKRGDSAEKIKKDFLEIVTHTQPMNDPMYTSNFMSSKNPWFRMSFGVFQTARDAVRRGIHRNIEKIRNRNNKQGTGSRLGLLKNLLTLTVVNNALIAAVQELFYQIGRDDEDLDEVTISWAMRTMTNTMSLGPILGDVVAAVINGQYRGWQASVGETPGISQSVKTLTSLAELMKAPFDEKDDNVGEAALEFSADLATSLGNAWGNVERMSEKLYKEFLKEEPIKPRESRGGRTTRPTRRSSM